MLAVDNIRFAYPGQQTPYNFCLHINPGEIVAVTGPSGAGKSTLLDLLGGFLLSDAGTIVCDTADLTMLAPEQRPISILFQTDNLFDHLTVATNLELGLPKNTEQASKQAKIAQALKEVDLAGLEKRRATELSGGQKQRVALARTLLRNQPILLLDEPFTGLDTKTASVMRTLIRKLTTANNWHVILISHDMDDVKQLADRALTLCENQLQPSDTKTLS